MESGLALAAFEGAQHGVEGAGGGAGGGDVTGAVAVRLGQIHADAPGGHGGVVGGHGLDAEHDLDFVAGVEGGEADHGAIHAPVAPGGWFVGVKRQGSHDRSNGLGDEGWVDRAVGLEDGVPVVGRGGFGDVVHVRVMF